MEARTAIDQFEFSYFIQDLNIEKQVMLTPDVMRTIHFMTPRNYHILPS